MMARGPDRVDILKGRSYRGESSGSPVRVEGMSLGRSCDTLFGFISWSRQHPVVQVLLSEEKQITNGMYQNWQILHAHRLER